MYDYYDYGTNAVSTFAGFTTFGLIIWLVAIVVSVFSIICMWKVFTKAGKPGWAAIIPVYNIIVMLEITELPMWYIALFFVPGANIYALIKIYIELAHRFGKSTGFGVGMAFLTPIFMAMIAFNKNVTYQGGQTASVQPVNPQPVESMNVQPQVNVQPTMIPPVMPEVPVQPVNPQSVEPMNIQPQVNVQPTMVPPVMPEVPVQPVNPQSVEPMNVQPQVNVQPTMVPPAQPEHQIPKFCTKCGNPTIPGTKFCVKCGNQL